LAADARDAREKYERNNREDVNAFATNAKRPGYDHLNSKRWSMSLRWPMSIGEYITQSQLQSIVNRSIVIPATKSGGQQKMLAEH
jgi:hypothetical protein